MAKAAKKKVGRPKRVRKEKGAGSTVKKKCWSSEWSMRLAIVMFAMIIIKTLPGALGWVERTSAWWFVLLLIIFLIKPIKEGK